MKKYILRLSFWAIKRYGINTLITPEGVLKIRDDVKIVVDMVNNMQGLLSNEYRHAHAYATLKKRLPNAKSRDIGLCIEMVIYGLI